MNGIHIKTIAKKLVTVFAVMTIITLLLIPSKKPIHHLQEQLPSSYSIDQLPTQPGVPLSYFMDMRKKKSIKKDSRESLPKFDSQESILLWQSQSAPSQIICPPTIGSNQQVKSKWSQRNPSFHRQHHSKPKPIQKQNTSNTNLQK